MSTVIKIVFGLLAGLIVIALCAAGLAACTGKAIIDQVGAGPDEAAQIAAAAADFTLPEGFTPQYGAHVMGIDLAAYGNGSERTHLFIAQAGPDSTVSREDLQKALGDLHTDTAAQNAELRVISRTDLTVRGQPATCLVTEGANKSGQTYREITLFFQGKAGPALANISAPTAEWDEEAFTQFIESIR